MYRTGDLPEPWKLDAQAGGLDPVEYFDTLRRVADEELDTQTEGTELAISPAEPVVSRRLSSSELAMREFFDNQIPHGPFGD